MRALKKDKEQFRAAPQANPQTAIVHMFHGALWGGWQFQVTDVVEEVMNNNTGGSDGKGATGATIKLGYGAL